MAKETDDQHKVVATNRKAYHDYFIEERLEAGVMLKGWEVKSLRAGRLQIAEAYVLLRNDEAWLFGAQITPLISASTHVVADDRRTRKLLLHRHEIDRLIDALKQSGRLRNMRAIAPGVSWVTTVAPRLNRSER